MSNLEALEEAIFAAANADQQDLETYLASTCASDLAYEISAQLLKMGYEIVDKDK